MAEEQLKCQRFTRARAARARAQRRGAAGAVKSLQVLASGQARTRWESAATEFLRSTIFLSCATVEDGESVRDSGAPVSWRTITTVSPVVVGMVNATLRVCVEKTRQLLNSSVPM